MLADSAAAGSASSELVAAGLAHDSFGDLVRRLGLDRSETAVLALVAAVELDRARQLRCRELARDGRAERPTLGLLRSLDAHHGAGPGLHRTVAPGGLLDRAGLVEVEDEGPWAARQVGVPARVLRHLDDEMLPGVPDLPPGAELVPAAGPGVPDADMRMLLVAGADRWSRRTAVAARHPGRPLLVVATVEGIDLLALVREAVLLDAVLLLESDQSFAAPARRTLERAPVRLALSSRTEPALDTLPRRPWQEIRVETGMASERDWIRTVGRPGPTGVLLDHDQLVRVGLVLDGGPRRARTVTPRRTDADITAAVRRIASGQLDLMAQRTEPRYRWQDLVLPADQSAQLREFAARYRHRRTVYQDWGFRAGTGAGVIALFAGPSGTGKTMAAEVVAGDLGLDLYRVDLAAVVSKYIGETEKNLDQIFDAARAAAAVLLFDEADALFGRRTEVSDSHDRYANIEVSYLLQRLEHHDGCVVLTTNLKRNIDPAFVRRLSISVDFPPPGAELRRQLWRRQFSASVPTGELDLDLLAERFEITGGMIRSAAVTAAFLAADRGEPLEMPHLVSGLARELQKAGRLQSEADFEPYRTLAEVDRVEPVG